MMPAQPLPPSALEAGLLANITSMERLASVQTQGIEKGDFHIWGGVYTFICQHAEQYAGVPNNQLIKAQWEEWDPPVGAFEYFLGEFLRHRAAYKAEVLIREAQPQIELAPDTAIPALALQLGALQYAGNTHIVATDGSIGARVQKYEARKQVYEQSQGSYLWGIPTGLDVIDMTHQGWMPGELVGFYARPTVGKTWMLVRQAALAWANGYRVLMISPEVSAKHVALRIDVFLAHAMGIALSHKKIFEGHPSQEEAYRALAQSVQQSERWWTVDSLNDRPLGLRDLGQLARQFEPDFICIDGAMLLVDDEKASSSWEKMDHICYGLKNMATARDLVIMMSHQAVNMRKGQRGNTASALGRGDDWIMPTLNDAAGGEAFARACSTIFTMAPDIKHQYLRWYSVRKTRERQIDPFLPRYALAWNVDKGQIDDLSKYGEDMIKIEEAIGGI